jgi:hypothetical protein
MTDERPTANIAGTKAAGANEDAAAAAAAVGSSALAEVLLLLLLRLLSCRDGFSRDRMTSTGNRLGGTCPV